MARGRVLRMFPFAAAAHQALSVPFLVAPPSAPPLSPEPDRELYDAWEARFRQLDAQAAWRRLTPRLLFLRRLKRAWPAGFNWIRLVRRQARVRILRRRASALLQHVQSLDCSTLRWGTWGAPGSSVARNDVKAIGDGAKAPVATGKARCRCPSSTCPRRACHLLRKIATDPYVRRVIVAVLRSLLRTVRERRTRDLLAWSAPVAATLWNSGLLPAPLTGYHD